MTVPPRFCVTCRANRVAWTNPKIDCCYDCLPGGPFTPPPCRGCGSGRYFSQGLCEICHPGAPKHPGSCKDCLAWGVLREHNWRCFSCRGWRERHPVAACPYCARQMPIGSDGACRLCWRQAINACDTGEPFDLVAANQTGQQLFLANLTYQRGSARKHHPNPPVTRLARRQQSAPDAAGRPAFRPVAARQLTLFQLRPNLISLRMLRRPPDPVMAAHCDAVLREHAARHGWSKRLTDLVAASLRALQVWQDAPGTPIRATDAQRLLSAREGRLTLDSTLEILEAAGLLDDDRQSRQRRVFLAQTAGLPPAMRRQLEIWFEVMDQGSAAPPRRRPRDARTIEAQIRGMAPALRAWAAHGHDSLTEITPNHIRAALPEQPATRALASQGLRSLFRILKSRREVFTNPTAGVAAATAPSRTPMPLDTDRIRHALNAPNPARALAVALVAFHGLTAREIRNLRLTDAHDGRLRVGDRDIPLAGPVRVRLRAYLDQRARRFPATTNPYLLVNRRSAPRTTPVSPRYPWQHYEITPRRLREDRILHEIFATRGDVRRICDLFGLSIPAAMRYNAVLETTHGAAKPSMGSPTHDPRYPHRRPPTTGFP